MYLQQNYQGQNIYNNQQRYNNYQQQSGLERKNQINLSNNNNMNNYNVQRKNNQNSNPNKKYADLQIETFFNDGNRQNISGKDIELNNKLNILTNQYMSIFDNVNKMANQFSGGNNEMVKVNDIKKELAEADSYFATEHGKFVGELYEISNDPKVLTYDYPKYKSNPKDSEDNLKKIILNFQDEVILNVNKNNSQENITRLKNYINAKKKNKNNNNSSYNNSNYNQNNNSNYNQNNSYNNQNNNSYNFGRGNIYGEQNNNNDNNNYGFGNSIYSNSNNNNKYPNPNEVGNDIYGQNNYNPNQYEPGNYNEKINVSFIYQNNTTKHEFNSTDSAELLFYTALEIKDDPKIYDKNGRCWDYDKLKPFKVGKIFEGVEPILNIY